MIRRVETSKNEVVELGDFIDGLLKILANPGVKNDHVYKYITKNMEVVVHLIISMYRSEFVEGNDGGISTRTPVYEGMPPVHHETKEIEYGIMYLYRKHGRLSAMEYMRDQVNNPLFYENVLDWFDNYISSRLNTLDDEIMQRMVDMNVDGKLPN